MDNDWFEQVEIISADLEGWFCKNRWLKVSRLTRLVRQGSQCLENQGMVDPDSFRLKQFLFNSEMILRMKRNKFTNLRG